MIFKDMIEKIQPNQIGIHKNHKNYIIYMPKTAECILVNCHGKTYHIGFDGIVYHKWIIKNIKNLTVSEKTVVEQAFGASHILTVSSKK